MSKLMFSLYARIETRAGGIGASDRAFIRAVWSMFSADGKQATPRKRELRRIAYREVLETRDQLRGNIDALLRGSN